MKNIIIISLSLASCGKASDVYVTQDSQMQQEQSQTCEQTPMHGSYKYQYTYSESHCSTGCHSAQSKRDYCTQLQDDAVNNFCAKQTRQTAFDGEGCK